MNGMHLLCTSSDDVEVLEGGDGGRAIRKKLSSPEIYKFTMKLFLVLHKVAWSAPRPRTK